jgi:predicted Zn-dependent peptidase
MILKGRSLTQIFLRSSRFSSTSTYQLKSSEVNGYRVITATTPNTVPLVGIVQKAGSRYDSELAPGLSYVLQQIGFEGNLGRYASSYLRPLEHLGVDDFTIERDREDLTYRAHIPQDSVEEGLGLLFDAATQDRLPWEEYKFSEKALEDTKNAVSTYLKDPSDFIHANAFRGQSLGVPLQPKITEAFSLEQIRTSRKNAQLAFVGSGIDHQLFVDIVQKITASRSAESSQKQNTNKTTYVGGGELRVPTSDSFTQTQVIFQGAENFGQYHAELAVAVEALGNYEVEGRSGALARLAESANFSWASSGLISYSDAGLLVLEGIAPASNSAELPKALNDAVLGLKSITKEQLDAAKASARRRFLYSIGCNAGVFNYLKKQVSLKNPVSVEDTVSRIDSVSLSSFKEAIALVSKSRPIVFAVGQVHSVQPLQ